MNLKSIAASVVVTRFERKKLVKSLYGAPLTVSLPLARRVEALFKEGVPAIVQSPAEEMVEE